MVTLPVGAMPLLAGSARPSDGTPENGSGADFLGRATNSPYGRDDVGRREWQVADPETKGGGHGVADRGRGRADRRLPGAEGRGARITDQDDLDCRHLA